MPNNERSLTTYNSALLTQIAAHVCQAIIAIQQQQPELLLEKYRKVQWQSNSNQSALSAKFTALLSQTQGWEELLHKLQLYLKAIVVTEAFHSPILLELITKIRQLNPVTSAFNGSLHPTFVPSLQQVGIAVLLLDAENLQINSNTEKFFTTICNCPIQVKIAFANWSNRGKLDVELHERGYDLIHVPAGRDNADGKMIAFGSSIHERYPNAKEVLVCSSDKVMTNLCNNLQQHGLIVYQVSQHGENINLFNSFTGETKTHCVKPLPEIPSLLQILKVLINDEKESTGNQWVKVSKVFQLLNTKHKINMSQVIATHLPGKKPKDIFTRYPADFVIHKVDDSSDFYVTVFDKNLIEVGDDEADNTLNNHNDIITSIDSQADLEKALHGILETLIKQSVNEYVDVSILGSKFNQEYGKAITKQLKELQISGSYIQFLQFCSGFQLRQKGAKWEISTSKRSNSQGFLSSINTSADLESAIKKILEELTKNHPQKYIDISILGTKFNQEHGKTITEQIKELKINTTYMKFLQSCSSLQLKQTDRKWEVAIR
ncbi:NYN domain-containing protein [Trichormus sp. NMC-1]|uniref:NYN domain-containing protein n=1 Tax=Trichormus sp. NMC-1 TaxID=1853259 RepID=UPI0008DC1899|nr:NYN domain-containing protein [Trichormus sp. NMC-1]